MNWSILASYLRLPLALATLLPLGTGYAMLAVVLRRVERLGGVGVVG